MSGTSGPASWLSAVTAATCLVVATVAPVGPVRGQEDGQAQGSADVRRGTCAEPGDAVALLEPVPGGVQAERAPADQDQSDTAAAVVTSVTQVPLAFEELTSEPHIIAVEGSDTGSLCATIGGRLVEDGGVASALLAANGQPVGVVWLQELGLEATMVHVFLLAAVVDGVDASPDPSASPEPSPAASPSGEDGVLPEGEIDPREDIDVDVAH
jgi:hypothetical protein